MKRINKKLYNYKLERLLINVFCIIGSILFVTASTLNNETLINLVGVMIILTGLGTVFLYKKKKK